MSLEAYPPLDPKITRFYVPANSYPPRHYAAFVLDPDGNNIEVVFREE